MITTRWGRARTWAVAGAGAATGLVLVLGAAPAGAVAPRATVSATYACTTTVLGQTETFTSPISITGKTVAGPVAPGTLVKMTGFYSKVTIPQSLVAKAESYGVTWVSGKITSWSINASHATTKTKNAAGSTGLAIPQTNLPNPAAAVTIRVPSGTTTKTVGPWTAAAGAGTMVFTDGTLKFTLNDNLGVSLSVTCSPHPAITISKTTVS
jgi:hypothetical protein